MSLSKHLTLPFEGWKERSPVKKGLYRVSLTFLILIFGTPILLTAQECNLEGTPKLELAQTYLQQTQDTSLSEYDRVASAEKAWSAALQGPIESDTENATYYYFGALTQVQLGNYGRVDSLLNVFLEKAPDGCRERAKQIRFQAWANIYNQATTLYQEGNHQKALQKYETANRIYTDFRSLADAAVLHQQLGNDARAEELYEQALRVGGDPKQMKLVRGMLKALRAKTEKGDEGPTEASSREGQEAEASNTSGAMGPLSRVADSFGAEAAEMGIQQKDLRQRANPHGPGTFVCSSQTQFSGFTRIPLWFAWEDRIYALNGPALTISGDTFPPGYPRPESAPRSWWKKAGLIPNPIQKGINVCYPSYESGGG